MLRYLFAKPGIRGKESVALTVDSWVSTPSNSIHFPMGVVIVHHMEVPVPTPGHSLNKAFTEVVESNGDLHVLVLDVGIAGAQKHDFIMVRHEIVGNGDCGGPLYGVDQPVPAVRQRAVVHPDMARPEDRHPVPVRQRPPPVVGRRRPHHGVPALLAVVDVDPVDDHVRHVLHRYAGPTRDVHAGAPPVDRLERVHDQLLLQLDRHVPREDDPQRLLLDHAVPERPRLRVHRVVVPGFRHRVYLPVFPADCVLAEPDRAVG